MSPPPASWIRKIDITANLEGCNRACAIDYAAFWGFFFPEPP